MLTGLGLGVCNLCIRHRAPRSQGPGTLTLHVCLHIEFFFWRKKTTTLVYVRIRLQPIRGSPSGRHGTPGNPTLLPGLLELPDRRTPGPPSSLRPFASRQFVYGDALKKFWMSSSPHDPARDQVDACTCRRPGVRPGRTTPPSELVS